MLTENRAVSFPAVVALPQLTPSHSLSLSLPLRVLVPIASSQPDSRPAAVATNKKLFAHNQLHFNIASHCCLLLIIYFCLCACLLQLNPVHPLPSVCLPGLLCICTNEAQDEDADGDEERERQWHPALTIIISLRKLEARTCRGVPVVVNQPPAAGKQNTLNGIPESCCCQLSRSHSLSSSFYAPSA